MADIKKVKAAVVNLMKVSDGSIIASNRISQYLCEILGLPLVDQQSLCSKYDILFIVNGPMLYCKFRDQLRMMVEQSKRVIWVMNDYAIPVPGFVKAASPVYWSSCDPLGGQDSHVYTNWNQLTFFPDVTRKDPSLSGLCYYGAYRPGREFYFRKYLSSAPYEVFISSSKNGQKDFQKISPDARFFPSGNIIQALQMHKASIYLEDKKSHSVYTSPANRFYECLSAHTLMLFDVSVSETFKRAEIDVSHWIVDGPDKVKWFLKNAGVQRDKQMASLRTVDFHKSLREEVMIASTIISGKL